MATIPVGARFALVAFLLTLIVLLLTGFPVLQASMWAVVCATVVWLGAPKINRADHL